MHNSSVIDRDDCLINKSLVHSLHLFKDEDEFDDIEDLAAILHEL